MGLDITLHTRTSSENAAWMPYPLIGVFAEFPWYFAGRGAYDASMVN